MTHKFNVVADYGWGGALLFTIPFVKHWYLGRITETVVETRSGEQYLWKDLVRIFSRVNSSGVPLAIALDFGKARVQINFAALRNGPQIWAAIRTMVPELSSS